MEALKVYGKDYLSISRIVGTRDVKQVKSHAQKFMQMLKKSNKPEDQELIRALEINLRVLKHSERNTYRGGEVEQKVLESREKDLQQKTDTPERVEEIAQIEP